MPADFVQNKVPKLLADDLSPVSWPADPGLEWAPPGHGDLYTALVVSGMLDTLLEHGYRYAFVSNADNLGAVDVELSRADLDRLDAASALPREYPGWMIERQSGLRPPQQPRRMA